MTLYEENVKITSLVSFSRWSVNSSSFWVCSMRLLPLLLLEAYSKIRLSDLWKSVYRCRRACSSSSIIVYWPLRLLVDQFEELIWVNYVDASEVFKWGLPNVVSVLKKQNTQNVCQCVCGRMDVFACICMCECDVLESSKILGRF